MRTLRFYCIDKWSGALSRIACALRSNTLSNHATNFYPAVLRRDKKKSSRCRIFLQRTKRASRACETRMIDASKETNDERDLSLATA